MVVSFHIPTKWYEFSTSASTFHHLASQTTYILPGDQVMVVDPSVEKTSTSWFFVSRVDRLVSEIDSIGQQVVELISAEAIVEANRRRDANTAAAAR